MLDRLSVPRRTFDFEDYIDILRRNVRWIIAPAFAGLVISTVAAYLMEDTYVSQALIRVVPQQISTDLVQRTSSQNVADHINAMAENILSRNALTSLINTHGLYKKELKSEPLEDILDKMRTHAIGIRATTGAAVSGQTMSAMQVSFSYGNPYVARDVCQDIVGRFTSENSQTTLEGQEQTQQFLNDEFDRAKRDLDTIEQKLADYEKRNEGHLPDEMQMNISQMNALDGRLSALTESISRNNEQRMMLESELHIAKDRLAAIRVVGSPQAQAHNEKLTEIDKQIDALDNTITAMKDRYTDDFPDLQAARDRMAALKKQREDLAKEKAPKIETPIPDNSGMSRERLDAQGTVEQLQTRLKANALEGQQLNSQLGTVNGALRNYQSRVETVPEGLKEYSDLLRDKDLAKKRYDDFQEKKERSSVSMDLERRKQGETLEVLDQASLPTAPTTKRAKVIPIGALIGLVVGIILVAIRELKDTSLKNLKDARLYTQLSILGSIPLLENDLVVQRRKQIMWVGWATATVAGLAIMAGAVAHYYLNKA